MYHYLGFSFSSVYLHEHFGAYQNVQNFIGRSNQDGLGQTFQFVSLGGYDIGVITQQDDIENITKVQNEISRTGTDDIKHFIGKVIDTGGSPDINKLYADMPLCGVSLIKIKKDLLAGIAGKEPWRLLKEIANAIKTRIKTHSFNNFDFILSYSMGFEELILVLFCDDYYPIKKSICSIRSLTIYDLGLGDKETERFISFKTRHIFQSTYTLVSIATNQSETIDYNIDKVNSESEVTGVFECQVLPGHLDFLRHKYNDIVKSRIKTGKNDICLLHLDDKIKLREFLRLQLRLINELAKEDSPVVSVETSIGLDFKDELECGGSRNREYLIPHTRRNLDSFRQDMLKILPQHTSDSLVNIINDFDNCLKQPAANEAYSTIYVTFEIFIQRLLIFSKDPEYFKEKVITNNFFKEIQSILNIFHLGISDRQIGVAPLGDADPHPAKIFKSSYHKLITIFDYYCNSLSDYLATLAKEKYNQSKINTRFCVYFGNSPTPLINYYRNFPIAFINMPFDSLFRPNYIFYLLHEVGHCIIDNFAFKKKEIRELLYSNFINMYSVLIKVEPRYYKEIYCHDHFEKFTKLIEDAYADYFATQIVLNGNHKKYSETCYLLVQNILGSSFVYDRHAIRTELAKALGYYADAKNDTPYKLNFTKTLSDKETLFFGLVNDFLNKIFIGKSDSFSDLRSLLGFMASLNTNIDKEPIVKSFVLRMRECLDLDAFGVDKNKFFEWLFNNYTEAMSKTNVNMTYDDPGEIVSELGELLSQYGLNSLGEYMQFEYLEKLGAGPTVEDNISQFLFRTSSDRFLYDISIKNIKIGFWEIINGLLVAGVGAGVNSVLTSGDSIGAVAGAITGFLASIVSKARVSLDEDDGKMILGIAFLEKQDQIRTRDGLFLYLEEEEIGIDRPTYEKRLDFLIRMGILGFEDDDALKGNLLVNRIIKFDY